MSTQKEATSARLRRLEQEVFRLIEGLRDMGFEAFRVDEQTPEGAAVATALSTVRQLAALAGLEPGAGWVARADKLRRGMVIDYGPFHHLGSDDPTEVVVEGVTRPDADGMVRILGQDGFFSTPKAGDWPFQLVTDEHRQWVGMLVGAEQDRLGIARPPAQRDGTGA